MIGKRTFERQVKKFGKTVIVHSKTEKLDEEGNVVRDNNHRVVYNETTVSIKCLLQFNYVYEKTDVGYAKTNTKMLYGFFKLSDEPYVNKINKVEYKGIKYEISEIDDITGPFFKVLLI